MSNKTYDCVIVGAGISGISFAHHLAQQGKRVLIVEKNAQIGGEIQSVIYEGDSNYWREMGAHTCYNSYTHLLNIVKDLKIEDQLQTLDKGSYVIYDGTEIKSVMSEIKFPSLILNGLKLFFSSRKDKTVKEYFGNIVGHKNYEHLFTRLFRAVLSQNADEYPAESFLKKRDGRYEDFPRKYSAQKGLHHLLNLMVVKNNLEVITNTEISEIEYNNETEDYRLTTLDGTQYIAPSLAMATTSNVSAQLLANIEPQLSTVLNTISMFRSQSVNVVVKREDLELKAVAGIIPTSDEFLSAVSRDLVHHESLRSFTFHFSESDKTLGQLLELICRVLKINRNQILETTSTKHILPSLRLSHRDIATQVADIKKNDNLFLLGNYFYGLSIEDCVNRSWDEAQRFLG